MVHVGYHRHVADVWNKPNQKLPISPEILWQIKSLWLPHEMDPTYM